MNNIAPIGDYRLNIKYDGSFPIATGKSRMEKNWKNKTMTWSGLLKRLETVTRTTETYKEYMALSKSEQDQIKDVGGFVGGSLKSGRRRADSVSERQIVTLDADFAPVGMLEDLEMFADYAYAVYSTHKHTPEKPRLRLLIPLDRPVTPDEYEAIARKLADDLGIDYFDDTTYQPSRLMYWPSVAHDGKFVFTYEDLKWLEADKVLARYPDWTDTSYWPESSRTKEQRRRTAKKQGDPTEKPGLIGAFCRTYTVEEAIEKFIPDSYAKCVMPGRYTYVDGSTAAGLVLYEDGKFAYSNHATDPAGGKLCNAFDLVRIHKFGIQDEDTAPDTAMTKLPSYEAMITLAQSDKETKLELASMKHHEAEQDFPDEDEVEWQGLLEYDKKGNLLKSLNNVLCIMQHDPRVKGIVFNQMADNLEIKDDVPWKHPNKFWRDADDAQLESFLADKHTEFSKAKIQTAITKVADDRSYHPVREYLNSLPVWDGIPRVDTLLIDYLGAEDNEYVRAVTRKTLCAAVARVKTPGCKFDIMLVLCGPQGIGKSTLVHRLGGEWFSDSLTISDMKDKTAAEKLQGYWIVEVGELAGLRKLDVETIKGFLSRQDDKYRASYGRVVGSHPRQSIIIGTTNAEDGYLRDPTGGRRFWPVSVPAIGKKRIWDMTEEEVNQIWAEVLVLYPEEKLFLSESLQVVAEQRQLEVMETDEREGFVREYLERRLPDKWDEMDIYDRRDFLNKAEDGTVERLRVSNVEIWCECLENKRESIEPKYSYAITAIMKKIGWKKGSVKVRIPIYGTQWVYYKNQVFQGDDPSVFQ